MPGIGPSPDKMLLGRLFSYPDTHRYRIGTNYMQIPVNAPHAPVHSYNKDGAMRFRHNGDQPVYAPNSFGGPAADPNGGETTWDVEGAEMVRHAYTLRSEDDDFGQAGTLVRSTLSQEAVGNLVSNIVGHATNAVSADVQKRVVEYWTSVDSDLGARVAQGITKEPDTTKAGDDYAHAGRLPIGTGADTGV